MANNTLIGAIRAEATLESGKYVDGAKKIRTETKKTEAQLKTSFSAMGAAAKGFGGALTAGLSVGLLGGLAKKILDNVAALKTTAAQLGVTTKELQLFSYAAGQVGIKQQDADKALERLNASMGKAAAGSKTAIKAFGAVGVSIDDIKTKSKTEIFGQISDQMIKQGGAAKNAAAANAIFGESAAKLNPLLDKGSAGMNELAAAAERLGVVLSDSQIQNADETAQKLDDVKRVLAAQISGIVADNASSILSLADSLGKLTSAVINFLGSNPTAALGILGALAGSRFGLPGAALGGFAGMVAGANIASNRPTPENPALLRHNFIKATDEASSLRKAGKPSGAAYAKAKRLRDSYLAAGGSIPGYNPNAGNFGVPQFLASGGGSKKSGRSPKGPRDRSDDVSFQFEQELRRAQMDTLRAQQALATSSDDRARIALELLTMQRAEKEAELNNRVRKAERDFAEGKITAGTLEEVKAQAAALRSQYDAADALERKAIADDLAANKAHDTVELEQSAYDLKIEQLQNEAALKETASERREVELRILALMKEQEKARLEAVIADQQSSQLAKDQAQQRLDALDGIYAGRAATVTQGTRGPWEDWMASLPSTAAKAQEALERLQVEGMEGFIDSIMALSEGLGAATDSLLQTLKNFLLGVARMELQRGLASILPQSGGLGGIFSSIGGLFGGGGSSGGGGGFQLASGISNTWKNVPTFASGGGFNVRGLPGIDRNVMSMNGVPIARVSYNERVNIDPANDRGGRGRNGDTIFNIATPDADSFRRSEGQITRAMRRKLA